MIPAWALAACLWSPPARAGSDASADLMQDLSKASLEGLSRDDEKRRFLNTVTVEKMRIQQKLLENTFESALDLYHSGQYEGAQELAARILAIDPSFEDAAMLKNAAGQLKGETRQFTGQMKVVEQTFKQGLDLYQQNRLIEAQRKFQEVVELAPAHLKARYWLHRVQGELADVHYARGEEAYEAGELQKALDHWYAALMLNPGYPRLVDAIQRVENEKRRRDANRLMQQAVSQYGTGDTAKSVEILNQVLGLNPGDPKAQQLLAEIKTTEAEKDIAAGRKLYQSRKFQAAIQKWEAASQWGYDPEKIKALVARAQEMIHREEEAKKQREELAKKKAEEEEALKKKEAEAAAKKQKEEDEGGGEGGELSFKMDSGDSGGAEKPNTPAAPSGGADKAAPAGGAGAAPKMVEGQKVLSASGATELSPEERQKIKEANQREALVHYQSGMVFMQKNQLDQAKHELDEAKKLDPSNIEVDAALRRIDAIVQGQ